MANKNKKDNLISRRGIFPLLGSSLLIPFLGFGKSEVDEIISTDTKEEVDGYQILLKPDGTTVKVKTSTIKNAKAVKKNISNKSLHGWLNKKR